MIDPANVGSPIRRVIRKMNAYGGQWATEHAEELARDILGGLAGSEIESIRSLPMEAVKNAILEAAT